MQLGIDKMHSTGRKNCVYDRNNKTKKQKTKTKQKSQGQPHAIFGGFISIPALTLQHITTF